MKSWAQHRLIAVTMLLLHLVILTAFTRAQAVGSTYPEDPVERASKLIAIVVERQLEAAQRAVSEGSSVKEAGGVPQGTSQFAGTVYIETPRLVESRFVLSAEVPVPSDRRQPWLPGLRAKLPQAVLARYASYGGSLERILVEERLPVEAVSVAIVESGLNPYALSPKGARGMWQLMPSTARRYGLSVTPEGDHRLHVEHATRAAARYLRDLFEQFGDWKLALAAYNWGETRVQRLMNRTGLRNFDEMVRRRLVPQETRNYVPAVLATWSMLSASFPKLADVD